MKKRSIIIGGCYKDDIYDFQIQNTQSSFTQELAHEARTLISVRDHYLNNSTLILFFTEEEKKQKQQYSDFLDLFSS